MAVIGYMPLIKKIMLMLSERYFVEMFLLIMRFSVAFIFKLYDTWEIWALF